MDAKVFASTKAAASAGDDDVLVLEAHRFSRIYRVGESWSEPPGAIHSISRNASKTERAKLLAVFVLDTNDNPLTTPVK